MTISQTDVPQFYPVPPSGPPGRIPISGYPPQDPGFAPPPFQPQPEHSEMYPGSQQQCPPSYHVGQMPPHMPPQVPHSPVEMHHSTPQILQHMPPSPGHMPSVDQLAQAPLEASSSPRRSSFTQQKDLYDQMAHMVSVWSSEYLKTVPKSVFLQHYTSASLCLVLFVFVLLKFEVLLCCRVLGGGQGLLHNLQVIW